MNGGEWRLIDFQPLLGVFTERFTINEFSTLFIIITTIFI